MTKYLNIIVLPVFLIMIILAYSLINLSVLPPQIAIHFDSIGIPDGFLSRNIFPLIMTLFPVLIVSFISLFEFGLISKQNKLLSLIQHVLLCLKYLFIGVFLILTFEIVRYNAINDIISGSRILFGAVLITFLSVILVLIMQRKQ